MGAEVGRFERFVFLFLALFCQAFCFCFLGQYFFGTYIFFLEKLKVMFPFSTDTVTLLSECFLSRSYMQIQVPFTLKTA